MQLKQLNAHFMSQAFAYAARMWWTKDQGHNTQHAGHVKVIIYANCI